MEPDRMTAFVSYEPDFILKGREPIRLPATSLLTARNSI
ncbi:Uncharacterised protein [Alistipes sp. cv1]|nr:Uncharacterised protein [Faecalibacterium prausnitzii]